MKPLEDIIRDMSDRTLDTYEVVRDIRDDVAAIKRHDVTGPNMRSWFAVGLAAVALGVALATGCQ